MTGKSGNGLAAGFFGQKGLAREGVEALKDCFLTPLSWYVDEKNHLAALGGYKRGASCVDFGATSRRFVSKTVDSELFCAGLNRGGWPPTAYGIPTLR